MPALPSSRNQSIDLHSKSIDWFPYEGKTGILWVKQKNTQDHYYVKLTQRQQRPHLNIITVVLVVPLVLILNNLHSLLDKIVVIYIFFLSLSSSKYLIEQESILFNLNSVPKIHWNGKCILLKFIFNTWNLSWNLSFENDRRWAMNLSTIAIICFSHAYISYIKRSLEFEQNEVKVFMNSYEVSLKNCFGI